MLNYLVTFFCTCSIILSGQTDINKILKPYKEDQIYIGLSFINLTSKNKELKQNGLSSHFHFGVVKDIPLVLSGKVGLGLGFGYSFQHYKSNLIRSDFSDNKYFYTINRSDSNSEKMLISFNSLEIPLSIRLRNSSITDFEFWRFYTGIKFQRNFYSKISSSGIKKNVSNDINPWTQELYLSFGYNTWNFYFSYGLKPIIKRSKLEDSYNENLNFNALKIGLIFYLL
jgi:hypothetical protein